MKNYNPWYTASYDGIVTLPIWRTFDLHIGLKLACVYSWMPQTIMGTRRRGKSPAWENFALHKMETILRKVSHSFEAIKLNELLGVEVDSIAKHAGLLFEAVLAPLGSSAASKYLHFSAPHLFPMWDRYLRVAEVTGHGSDAYLRYMIGFQKDLRDAKNLRDAASEYPGNPIRGWDIVKTKRKKKK